MATAAVKLKDACSRRKSCDKPRNHIKKAETKVHIVRTMVFPVMYGCESWTIKKVECQKIDAFEPVVLEKTLESPLDCKEIQPVHPKGDQSWVFIEAEAPILWPPHAKSRLI